MATGRIKWFNDKKGIGFIESAEDEDIFLHYNSFVDWKGENLPEGTMVEFDINESDKGKEAKQVRFLSPLPEEVDSSL